jgi:acyl CoA:acetate/3-ketoacid CoA transferase beta subunit
VIVTMTATTSDGAPKLVPECTYPLTPPAAVDAVITEQAVFRSVDGTLTLPELVGGTPLDGGRHATSGAFAMALEAAS